MKTKYKNFLTRKELTREIPDTEAKQSESTNTGTYILYKYFWITHKPFRHTIVISASNLFLR